MPSSKPKKTHQKISILGIPIHRVDDESIARLIDRFTATKECTQVAFVNWWNVIKATVNFEYRTVLKRASLVVPTSHLLSFGARVGKQPRIKVHTPLYIIVRLFSQLERHNMSIVLVGMENSDIQLVEHNILNTYPSLRIVGRYPGYFDSKQETAILTAIRKANPQCVFVGSGVPQDDVWLYRAKHKIHPLIMVYSKDVMNAFAAKQSQPTSTGFTYLLSATWRFLKHPWRIYRFFVFLFYVFALLYHRLFINR